MKQYTIEIVINEGSDEFWESIYDKTGTDEVLSMVKDVLAQGGLFDGDNCKVTLKKFETI